MYVTTLTIMGEEYDVAWDSVPVSYDDPRELPEVEPGSVYSHTLSRVLSWEEFQERTLWYYDAARLSGLVYSAQTLEGPVNGWVQHWAC